MKLQPLQSQPLPPFKKDYYARLCIQIGHPDHCDPAFVPATLDDLVLAVRSLPEEQQCTIFAAAGAPGPIANRLRAAALVLDALGERNVELAIKRLKEYRDKYECATGESA